MNPVANFTSGPLAWRWKPRPAVAAAYRYRNAERVQEAHSEQSSAPGGVLIVEHRDEIFARLAADLGDLRVPIMRAMTAAEARRRIRRASFDLVLAPVKLIDESAWLMVSKLRLGTFHTPVWLYSPVKSTQDDHWCEFTRIDGIVYYRGNLWRLSSEIKQLIGGLARVQQGQQRTTENARFFHGVYRAG